MRPHSVMVMGEGKSVGEATLPKTISWCMTTSNKY